MKFPWRAKQAKQQAKAKKERERERKEKCFSCFDGVEMSLMIIQGAFALIIRNDCKQILHLHCESPVK